MIFFLYEDENADTLEEAQFDIHAREPKCVARHYDINLLH